MLGQNSGDVRCNRNTAMLSVGTRHNLPKSLWLYKQSPTMLIMQIIMELLRLQAHRPYCLLVWGRICALLSWFLAQRCRSSLERIGLPNPFADWLFLLASRSPQCLLSKQCTEHKHYSAALPRLNISIFPVFLRRQVQRSVTQLESNCWWFSAAMNLERQRLLAGHYPMFQRRDRLRTNKSVKPQM